jgi:hypothetical protein
MPFDWHWFCTPQSAVRDVIAVAAKWPEIIMRKR